MRRGLMAAQDLGHACDAESFVGSEAPAHLGQNFSDSFWHASWNDRLTDRIILSFNEVERSAAEFTIVQHRRVFGSCLIGSVQPPIARDDIHMAVTIQISRIDSIPPAGEPGER